MSGDTQTLSEFEAEQRTTRQENNHDLDAFDFDFAQLFPVNESAKLAFDELAKLKDVDLDWNPHARNFLRVQDEIESLREDEDSDSSSTGVRNVHTGCFRLSLGLQPARLARGWVIGAGRQALSDPDVDLLITVNGKRDRVRGRHAQIVIHRETRLLMLKVPPKKTVFLDGVLLTDGSAALTKQTSGILIGNLAFQLVFNHERRSEYIAQLDKMAALSSYFTGDRIETVDPTPSDQYFTLRGYQFQTPQAAGAYGVVSACIKIQTGDAYAVKRVKKSRHTIKEVEKELNMLEILDTHPHICSLVEHFTLGLSGVQEMYMILTPYAPRTLMDLMRHPPSPVERLDLLHQAARGLQHVHACGIIHRDIKPDNMLVTSDLRVVITDFGHSTTETASQDHFKGTLSYLPPEIYELKEIISTTGHWSAASDIFSFAVIAFELIHQQFKRNRAGMIGRTTQLTLVQNLNPAKDSIDSLLIRMLSWDSRKRPSINHVVSSSLWPASIMLQPSKKRQRDEDG